jgi:uncharacterized protein YukE
MNGDENGASHGAEEVRSEDVSAPSAGFKIDVEALRATANQVAALIDSITASTGLPGNLADFRDVAGIAAPLATFWGSNHNVFDESFERIHDALLVTYTEIVAQLQNLETSIRNTAAWYEHQDEEARADVAGAAGT